MPVTGNSKNVDVTSNLLVELFCKTSSNPVGTLTLPISAMHRDLPNVWYEIPSVSKIAPAPVRSTSKAIVFHQDPLAEDPPLLEEKGIPKGKVAPSQVSSKPGIPPLALAGAAGVIVLLLAIFFALFY